MRTTLVFLQLCCFLSVVCCSGSSDGDGDVDGDADADVDDDNNLGIITDVPCPGLM